MLHELSHIWVKWDSFPNYHEIIVDGLVENKREKRWCAESSELKWSELSQGKDELGKLESVAKRGNSHEGDAEEGFVKGLDI